MIRATSIRKKYGDLEVLKGVDLHVSAGEVVSIVGASGAGKTTLLQILGTLERADSGTLEINGENVSKLGTKALSAFRNKHIGFVFQFHHLLPEFTALENVMMPGLIAGRSISVCTPRAMELLERLNVSARVQHKPGQLSGGEQQRVAVARALFNSPSVVLADEPSGNLDSAHAKELHQLFFDLRTELGQTFVIVTHNEELAGMADRRLVMKDGVM
ncbi:MAG: ABC transporter ATP-binding protein [Flavobacteriales bacterium]|nr:ABC transporter ATP-binding protein [Flavobacteriales bacterium]MBK6945564.1 ABC transporter ATP-binding protein [Flavobacteriales bacterium]MBK7241680.1 ABC transporter ATP-binding protein [Flavobacteriales bacterium]MBK7296335.1 ABC transporter ATP-binding protein [Flavobacteriales bacterium]MBK9534880.1 ABC transporter ATP-binding protein [Flavobacteriales bacterium]